jgi:uncharacterized hydrophobic protein (TIGR00271 family)
MSAEQEPNDENLGGNPPEGSRIARGEEDPTKIHIEKNPAELVSGLAGFFKSILSLRDGTTDIHGVLKNVKEGIVFSGYNVWILICSIIIASVGLNMDSTAVIIGAMLISPLMGPIRGIGFGVGTHDFKLLTESLKNFGITVGISILVSFLYFAATPIHEPNTELFGRIEPTFLDVMIAFFGGLAGVIALSKNKADTVIPGVAIATALMPPLCTAGYGLANGKWDFFLGAGYLFLLNSILIAISTYFFVRYLKFPKKEYVSPKIERRVKGYTIVFILIIVAPSFYMFWRMTKRSIFESNANSFVAEVIQETDENLMVEPTYYFAFDESYIQLDISNYYANEYVLELWNRQKANYDLKEVDLHVKQGKDYQTDFQEMLDDYSKGNQGANVLAGLLSDKENVVIQLQKKIDFLNENPVLRDDPLEMKDLLNGFKIDYPEYQTIAIDRGFVLNHRSKLDTIYSLKVVFKADVDAQKRFQLNSKISRRVKLELWQKSKFKQDSIRVYTVEQ